MTASAAVTIHDSDELLCLLLQSVPSRQHRRFRKQPAMETDELMLAPTLDNQLDAARQGGGGMLARIGALFGRITRVKHESNEHHPAVTIHNRIAETPVEDKEDELEVEYILLADKCVHPRAAPAKGKKDGRRGRCTRPRRQRKAKPSIASPPIIRHRPQLKQAAKARSKIRSPGF